jgi:O-antigen/teichoic acid export membrane protein
MTASASAVDEGAALRRIRQVFSVGMLANVLTLVTNFLIPPLFISAIGAERYGAWLYLFSIPTSLAMFDLGVSAAFSTEVYQRHVAGELALAARYFKTGVKVIGGLMLTMLGVAGALVAWRYHQQGDVEFHATMLMLCAYVLAGFMSELMSSSFKIAGRYHQFQVIGLVSKVAEIGVLLALIPTNDFRLMAAAMLGVRVASICLTLVQATRLAPGLVSGPWGGFEPFKHLVLPSLMYAVNPLIMFIVLQVPLLVIGPSAGMAAVVAYTTIRTLSRLPLQISSQISFSLYTEYTRLHASGQTQTIARLYRKSQLIIAGLFVAYGAGGLLLGPWVYQLWLKHLPPGFHILFAILLLDAVFESFMRNKICLTSSINQHTRDTLFQLVAACVSMSVLYVVSTHTQVLSQMLWPSSVVTALALLVVVWGYRSAAKAVPAHQA